MQQDHSTRDFVLAQPPDMAVTDVVAKAKEAGLTLSAGQVHNARYYARTRHGWGKGKRPKTGRPKGKKSANAGKGKPRKARKHMQADANDQETQYLKLALGIGLDRAGRLLEALRERLDSLWTE